MPVENTKKVEVPRVTGAARIAGVAGWPIKHTLSPRLHGYWLRHYRIDGAYVPLPVRPQDLPDVLLTLPKLGFQGVNLTFPHKEKALGLMHKITPAARRIGAVNTVVIDANGLLIGSNTDAFGFLESLRVAVPAWSADQGPAVVLGAGGGARAIVFALAENGATEIRLINRTLARAAALAEDMLGPVRPLPWGERARALAGARLLVNATTLGMRHQPPLELDLAELPTDAVVCDIVYAPQETALLAAARARGNVVVGGLGMLIHQARPGFAAWFGRMPEVTAELQHVLLGEAGAECSFSD